MAAVEIITNPLGVENVGFSSRPFVMTTFPAKRVTGTSWVRKNGNASLTVSVPAGETIPFGIDRLVPIFLATLAVKTKSRTITFDSVADILSLFGFTDGGINYRRLRNSIERVFNASIFFKIDAEDYRQQSRFHFISTFSMWKKDVPTGQSRLEGLPKNSITLSEEFFQEILNHPIPVDLQVVKILKNKPIALDTYLFLIYKSAVIKRTTRIPISELFGAFGSQRKNIRRQRMETKSVLSLVGKLSGVKILLDDDCIVLEPHKKSIRGV